MLLNAIFYLYIYEEVLQLWSVFLTFLSKIPLMHLSCFLVFNLIISESSEIQTKWSLRKARIWTAGEYVDNRNGDFDYRAILSRKAEKV